MRKQIIDDFNNVASLFYIIVGSVNDIASRAIVDATSELRKSKYFKAEVKSGAKYSLKKFYEYEDKLKRPLSDRFKLYMDITDEVYSLLHNEMERLRLAFKAEMDKHDIEDANIVSHVELAHTLIGYSIFTFDNFFKNAKEKHGRNFKNAFLSGRLSAVMNGWEKVRRRFAFTIKDLDFNGSETCKKAMYVIENKLTSETIFNTAGARALKLNPECMENLNEEDLKELKLLEE